MVASGDEACAENKNSFILSLCEASRMWVRHRSEVIVPPEGFGISVGLRNVFGGTQKCAQFIE